MARRKRQFLDDGDSDSSNNSENGDDPDFGDVDQDTRDERSLFQDPYKRKRRRKADKEGAIYGVFGDESEDEPSNIKHRNTKRNDWAKAPAFTTSKKVEPDEIADVDGDVDGDENSSGDEAQEDGGELEVTTLVSEESDHSRPASPRIRETEEVAPPRPSLGGIGSRPMSSFMGFSKAGIGSSASLKATFESRKEASTTLPSPAGVRPAGGAALAQSSSVNVSPSPSPSPAVRENLPTAFGKSRTQRAFVRDGGASSSSSTRPTTPVLTASERTHFNKISGSLGARLLSKMGWEAGTGLGVSGAGIVTPVESKIRPQKMGIAFKGFKEKTEQSKAEARRRGDVLSDDEDMSRRRKKAEAKRSDAWKKQKQAEVKIEHKSYEQIMAEAEEEDIAVPNIGKIIDARGATLREVSTLAEISTASWTPSMDLTRLPDVRGNLRLITDACGGDLAGLAREAKALQERRRWLAKEDIRLSKKVEEEAELISRLQQVRLVADEIVSQSNELASSYEPTLDPFTPHVQKLFHHYPKEFEVYCLDEVLVAAIAPLFRRMIAQWQPLEQPSEFIPIFKAWKQAARLTMVDRTPQFQVDAYGTKTTTVPTDSDKPMTPFDSLLWNIWLPKVRSCINNDWMPQDPQPAVQFYEAWSAFLPDFIRDNILDQLILPKVQKAVADWNPRTATVPLQTMVFPWLPHVGLRLEDFVGDSRRKLKSLLRAWAVGDPIPTDLNTWRDVFDASDWDAIMLKSVVPKLGATLRNDLRINPRNQIMEPIQHVLAWAGLLRPSIFSQLLQTEFFPKWLDVLHFWLIQPTVNLKEVNEWYKMWKDSFSADVNKMDGVAGGFMRGLQLMNQAMDLGPKASIHLPRPDHTVMPTAAAPAPVPVKNGPLRGGRPSRTQEITFRSIVEDFASSHNLLFMPTGKAHETSRMPLYRVSPTANGKGGILVYVLDDAVWTADGDEYRAVSLEEMVVRANV